MKYTCNSCSVQATETRDTSGALRCVKCGSKIFYKTRAAVARVVKAI